MKKRVFSILLAVVMMIGLLPTNVLAAGNGPILHDLWGGNSLDSYVYPVWVGGVQITDENKSDVLGDGTVSYDPATCTLTMSNATVHCTEDGKAAIYSTYPEYTFKIVGTGTNTISATGGSGIYTNHQNISITGGTFVISGSTNGIVSEKGKITINGAQVKATGKNTGAYALNGITMEGNGGLLTIVGNDNQAAVRGKYQMTEDASYRTLGVASGAVLSISSGKTVTVTDTINSSGEIQIAGTLRVPEGSGRTTMSGGTLYIGEKGFVWNNGAYRCIDHAHEVDLGTMKCKHCGENFYSVTVSASANGEIGADKTVAVKGEEVTLTVIPAESCLLESLNVNSENVPVTDGKYTFEMPDKDVVVTAVFSKIPELPEAEDLEGANGILHNKVVVSCSSEKKAESYDLLADTYTIGELMEDDGSYTVKVSLTNLQAYCEEYNETHTEHALLKNPTDKTLLLTWDAAGKKWNAPQYGEVIFVSCARYHVTWQDENGDLLKKDENVLYGTEPSFGKDGPVKESDAQYTYTFAGWTPEVVAVTKDATYTATYRSTVNTYTVTFKDHDGAVLDTQTVEYGKAAVAPASPTRTGYTFTGWDKAFDTITGTLSVTAQYKADLYAVTLHTNGGVIRSGNVTEYTYGVGAVLPTNVVRSGYIFAGWYDNPGFLGKPVTKIMPADLGSKTYYAKWRLNPMALLGSLSGGVACPCDGYDDVDMNAWYHDAVDYCLENGLMNGTGEGKFSPNGTMTRAMVWTVLGRLAGQSFDGTGENWYVEAQNWAIASGISDGANPNGAITREELVTMLWRFVGQPVVAESHLRWYNDGAAVSNWATDAMAWAVDRYILQGSNYNLNPQDTALRAQVAAILMRYFG